VLSRISLKAIFALLLFFSLLTDDSGAQSRKPVNQSSVEQLLAEAVAAFENSDSTKTKNILQRILKITPSNTAAHTLLAAVADRENNLQTAEKHFALAVRYAPSSPEARNNYGVILLRLNRKAEAAKEFAASLKINPNQLSALVNLAQIRFGENDLTTARQLFEKAKIIQPDAEIARVLVVIALRMNERERAAKDFQEYALAAKNAVVKTASRAELGTILLEKGLIKEAIQELETAFSIDSSDVDLIIQLGQAYAAQNDIKSAGKLLESAIARGLDNAKIYAGLADVYEAGGFVENAVPAMRLAIGKDPQNENYRFRYGMLLINLKAPAAAVIRLEEAVKDFPQSGQLWLGLGIAYFNDSKSSEAKAALEKALTLEPKSVPAMVYLANTFVEAARYDEAAGIYERAIAASGGKEAGLHFLLADALLNITTADSKRIENLLKRAIELDAKLAAAFTALGTLYTRQKQWNQAAAMLETAIQLQPENTKALYQLGQVYARLKRAEDSRTVLEKFKQLSKAEKEKKEVEREKLVKRLVNVRF
jgi:Tfp pilus assembly protein PilF